ncbi:MAG: hypothetical protein V1797_09835 [Pseudomonadota bacterium]
MAAVRKTLVPGGKLVRWLAWVGVGFVGGLMVASGWQLFHDSGRSRFERSLALRDQAVQVLEEAITKTRASGNSFALAAPPEEMQRYVDLLHQALDQARPMKTKDLNAIHPDLGRRWRDEFAAGLDLMILGYERKDPSEYFQGQVLDRKFDAWRRGENLGPR